jgi:hypothetical protein
VKIDVEGYEARVLDGASRLLSGVPAPFILIETADRMADQIGESARKVLGRLEAHGYVLYRLDELEPVAVRTTAAAAGGKLANYLATHPANPRADKVIDAIRALSRTGKTRHGELVKAPGLHRSP